jgi:hypothetical protein
MGGIWNLAGGGKKQTAGEERAGEWRSGGVEK